MRHEIAAARELVAKYCNATKAAWADRRNIRSIDRTRDELAFQPAVLELTESPASPVPHLVMRLTVAIFLILLLWAAVGKLDIVATASGKVVSDSRTKTIQAVETSIVRKVYVTDGQKVRRGQTLVELDAVGVRADTQKAEATLVSASLRAARSALQAASISAGELGVLRRPPGVSDAEFAEAKRLARSEFDAYAAKSDGLRSSIDQRIAEKNTTERSVPAMRAYAKIASDRVSDYKRLLEKNYVSRQEYLMREQDRINADRDLAAQENRVIELSAATDVAKKELASMRRETSVRWLDDERQARDQMAELQGELAHARERGASMTLTSPVDGTVQALATHTVGGVVTPAQALLSVVPTAEPLEVEAMILNHDIGFVRTGQEAVVKIESFPYTKYGYIQGEVTSVSHDAIKDEKLGLVFPVRVRLARQSMFIDGTNISVTPGMAVSLDVMTGKRTVLEYLLEPVKVHLSESLHER